MNKKLKNVVILTQNARHFNLGGSIGPRGADILIPTPNKEGLYHFPDGETYLRLPGLSEVKNMTIVHSGYPNPNDGLIELFMTLDIIRSRIEATSRVTVIFTSMPYARQDNAWYDGEINAAKALIENLTSKYYKVKKVIAFDAHFANESWTKKLPFENIPVSDALMGYARSMHPGMIFMAPDAGSTRRTNIKGAKKKRTNSYEVKVDINQEFAKNVKGKIVGVVDDILSTGNTLEKFYREAKRCGAKEVYALITHGVNKNGIARIRSLYNGLYMTNTINVDDPAVTISWQLVEAIERSFK